MKGELIEASDGPAPASPQRPARLREDAERNRKRLVEAASCAFAESGFEISVDEIARRAGVGKGTIFRRFPTKDALVAAIVSDRLRELLEEGVALSTSDNPGDAIRSFMQGAVQLLSRDRGLLEAMHGLASTDAEILAAKHRVIEVVALLLTRSQADGSIRADITACDIMLLVAAISHVSAPFRAIDSDLWRRYFDLIFDGLRPEAAHPCSHLPPTESEMQTATGCGAPGLRNLSNRHAEGATS